MAELYTINQDSTRKTRWAKLSKESYISKDIISRCC